MEWVSFRYASTLTPHDATAFLNELAYSPALREGPVEGNLNARTSELEGIYGARVLYLQDYVKTAEPEGTFQGKVPDSKPAERGPT